MFNLSISTYQILLFIVIFLRISAILFAAPLFGGKNVPIMAKIGISFALCICLFPVVSQKITPIVNSVTVIGIGIIGEVILGFIIGFSVRLVFTGIQLAGQLAGFQMGMSIANVLDPVSNNQVSMLSQLNYILAFLIFITINAHHLLIRALVESFYLVPPLEFVFSDPLTEKLIIFANDMFIIAIKIGAPIIATLLLTSVTLGLIARTVPQVHIFIVAMPIQILIGLSVTAIITPYFVNYLIIIFEKLGKDIFILLNVIR